VEREGAAGEGSLATVVILLLFCPLRGAADLVRLVILFTHFSRSTI
jgi:hypothetical protein